MMRAVVLVLAVQLLAARPGAAWDEPRESRQDRTVPALIQDLRSADPATRARAACDLRELGDGAAPALDALAVRLGDAAPLPSSVCPQRWSPGQPDQVTTPGEQAAAALVAIGSRAFEPLLQRLKDPVWAARRNAAWALGALDDRRAVSGLREALRDDEAAVREKAAWALGALDARPAVTQLMKSLSDSQARVRETAAWALGAIGDVAAVDALVRALADADATVREKSAWALGALGDARATTALLRALKDDEPGVRRQAAWAIGAIGR